MNHAALAHCGCYRAGAKKASLGEGGRSNKSGAYTGVRQIPPAGELRHEGDAFVHL